jgi:hypothetical protein
MFMSGVPLANFVAASTVPPPYDAIRACGRADAAAAHHDAWASEVTPSGADHRAGDIGRVKPSPVCTR